MKTSWSPVNLQTMLHHYYCPEPYPHPSEAIRQSQALLLRLELIRPIEGWGCFGATPKGTAFVKMLLATPMAETAFIDPRTKEVI